MLRGATVLHIEDQADIRSLVRKVLTAQGCRVLEAAGGIAGAEIALNEKPDLVILDVNLPDLDGYDVTTKIRGCDDLKGVPIVALTGGGDRELALALGCDGFIAKPFSPADLVARLERYLEGARDRRTGQHAALRRYGVRSVEKLEHKIAELEEAGQRVQRLERLRAEYLQNVTHELLTPLTPLAGYLTLLSKGNLGPLTDKQRKCLEIMRRSVDRLRRQIDNLTDLAHLEGGETVAARSSVEPSAIVDRALAACEETIVERRIEVRRSTEGVGPAMLDERMMARALAHMVDNAVKFSGIGAKVGVDVWRDAAGALEVSVVDSGIGIPYDFIERVFEPFQQVDGTATRKFGGAGLGLSIVRHVARAHGGFVWIESPPKRHSEDGTAYTGTRITLKIPPAAP